MLLYFSGFVFKVSKILDLLLVFCMLHFMISLYDFLINFVLLVMLFCIWVYAAERLGRAIVTDAITTPVVNTSAYFFKNTADLIDYKVLIFVVLRFPLSREIVM